ncbi:MAG: hypothetical protein HY303_03310 [Candidatus Wallbacteria bacterium]|nr:hypothetical protein [Candidatus Wallbacteria bacterium]
MLLAYQYLPLANLISRSDRVSIRTGEASLFDIHPFNLYNLALPTPFPDPASPYFFVSFRNGKQPFYETVYFGLPVLLLALASLGWMVRGRQGCGETEPPGSELVSSRSCIPALGAIALLAVGISVGEHLPLFKFLIAVVPPLKLFRYPGKYFFLAALTISLLAAIGFEGLLRRRPACLRIWGRGLGAAAMGLGLLLAGIWIEQDAFPRLFLTEGGAKLGGDLGPFFDMIRHVWFSNTGVALSLIGALGALTVLGEKGKVGWRAAMIVVAFASSVDLATIAQRSLLVRENALVLRTPEAVRALGPVLADAPPPRFVCYPLNDFEFGFQRTFLDLMQVEEALLFGLRGAQNGDDSMLSLLSVRTGLENLIAVMLIEASGRPERDLIAARCGASAVLSAEALGNVTGTTPLLAMDGPVAIRRLEGVSPRVFVAPRAEPASQRAMVVASAAIMALPQRVFYEPREGDAAGGRVLVPRRVGACRFEKFRRNSLEVAFDLEGEGLLVLLEKFHPGWRAWVEGQERSVLRAAGVFRGVVVRQGERRLRMSYEPQGLRVGGAVSLVCALLTLWGGLLRRRPGE